MIDGLDGLSAGEGSPSLESHLGSMLDGYSGAADDSTPEPAATDAGALPASTASAVPGDTPPATSTPEKVVEPALTGAPPVPAADAKPDTTPPEDDPFKDATPFTYTVNGQQRQADAIKRLGDHGAVIEAKDLPWLEQRLSERDHLYEKDQQTGRELHELRRLTEWRTTDDKGVETVLTGLKGVEAQRVQLGIALAAVQTLGQVFKQNPAALLAWGQDAEGNPTVDWNAREVQHLIRESMLAEMRAEQAVRSHLSTFTETVRQGVTQQQEDAQLPAKLWAAAAAAWVSQHPELTAEDKTFLQQQMPRYTRVAQKGEEHLGRVVLDPSFYAVIADRASLRKASADAVKQTAAATATATQTNAARLAAATIGKPKPAPAAPVVPPTPPTSTRASDAADAWDLAEQSAARMLRARSTA